MLASLLPGLRDLRTPLATGYLWLIAIWLLLHDRLPKTVDQATGPIRSLYQLGALAGTTASLAAVSFLAYILGSMLLLNLSSHLDPYILEPKIGIANLPIPARTVAAVRGYGLRGGLNYTSGRLMYRQLETFTRARVRESTRFKVMKELHSSVLGRPADMTSIEALTYQYVKQIVREFRAVGIQLQAKNRDLWDTYDRRTSEAQFRFGISPPLALCIALIAWQSRDPRWLVLLVVPLYLSVLGTRETAEAASTLVQSIVLKRVEPPVLERLSETVAKQKEEQVSPGKSWERPPTVAERRAERLAQERSPDQPEQPGPK
jgi:hypothetical protein